MKHEISLDKITIPRESMATVHMDLKLWPDAADATLSGADFSTSFSLEVKTAVQGMTAQQLMDRERPKIVNRAQSIIDKYKKEKLLALSNPVVNLISDIDGTLNS